MKSNFRKKITNTLLIFGNQSGNKYTLDEVDKTIDSLVQLHEDEMRRVIGEEEIPEQAEEYAKELTEEGISLAVSAVKFHARNQLRQEQLKRMK